MNFCCQPGRVSFCRPENQLVGSKFAAKRAELSELRKNKDFGGPPRGKSTDFETLEDGLFVIHGCIKQNQGRQRLNEWPLLKQRGNFTFNTSFCPRICDASG